MTGRKETTMKCISVSIFENKRIGNCSNNGISAKYDHILIEHPRGWIEVDENNPPENLCKLVKRELWGEDHGYIEPVKEAKGVGWMYGGCIVDSSDSRWSEISGYKPMYLHDRTETQEEYDAYSR